jgi:hypothetical protein
MDMEFLIPIAFFIMVAMIVKYIIDNKTRRMLIEKGMVDEKVKYLFRNGNQPFSSMKWGMVLVGIGLALLIGQIFRYDISEQATMGMMFLFAGIGFIIYYFMVKNRMDDTEK